MNLKKITSLTMLLSMIIMTYTGIMLFIAPPGRIAHWANWDILGLTKEEYSNIHSIFMVLFVIATLLHVYYNWSPMTSYMKNSVKQMIVFTKDMIVSTVVVVVFFIGALYEIKPFSSFLNFGSDIKEGWEKEYGTAPYSHAELSSLKSFCKKIGFDLEISQNILKKNNIKYELTKSISQIAKENNVSPKFIYDLLRVNFEKNGMKVVQLTGLGKKKIKDVAISLGISSKEFIKKLKAIGIDAKETDKFKTVAESNDMSPMDIITELGFKKPE